MNKLFAILTIFLLLTCTSIFAFKVQPVKATTIRVPLNYPTIQQAIDAANSGDTIIVSSGTYQEHIYINSKINLTIVAEELANTTIQGEENRTVVNISYSNHITFQGFIVRGTGYTYPQPLDWLMQGPKWTSGINVEYSSNIKLENNTITKNLYGVRLYYSTNVTMENNHIIDNVYNFGVEGGDDLSYYLHDIDNSNFVNGKRIYYEVNQSNFIIDSSYYSDIGYLGLINSQNITIKNLEISNNFQGLLLAYTNNSNVQNVDTSRNAFGIQLINSIENLVKDNEISANLMGLWIQGFGSMFSFFKNNNTVSANKISNNSLGMFLSYSGGNILRFNNITNNMFNFGVFGSHSDYIQDIDASNVVNGKPIYYLVDQHNQTVPSDAGYVAAVYSTNITVKDLTLSNNIQGVLFAHTECSLIENVVISDNLFGVYFSGDLKYPNASFTGNIISRSLVTKNLGGIWLFGDSDTTIIGNTITSNYDYGIVLWENSNNSIIGNTISDNQRGIYFDEYSHGNYVINNTLSRNDEGITVGYYSGQCIIHHNNFINNTKQVVVEPWSYSYENTWDNGYPSGGNYWSDYNGTDFYRGIYQNETGGDGIGDTPYIVLPNEEDNYPLMSPWIAEDKIPPTIGTPSREPENIVLPGQEVKVSISITDAISGVKNVTLFYTTDNGTTWISLPMNYTSSNKYEAAIRGQPEGTWVRYKIVAYDYAGNNATLDGVESYCTYEVVPEFSSFLVLTLFIVFPMMATILKKKKIAKNVKANSLSHFIWLSHKNC